MASSYTLQRVAGDGDVSYHVKLSAGGGRSDAAAGDQRKPILQQFPVSMLIHTRIMAIGNITATTFQCRFDLYVNWPEQMEGAVEFAQDLDEATLAGVSGDRAALAWQPLIRFPNAIEYTESRRLIFTDEVRRRIGQRTTVQGLFKVCSTGHGSEENWISNDNRYALDRNGIHYGRGYGCVGVSAGGGGGFGSLGGRLGGRGGAARVDSGTGGIDMSDPITSGASASDKKKGGKTLFLIKGLRVLEASGVRLLRSGIM